MKGPDSYRPTPVSISSDPAMTSGHVELVAVVRHRGSCGKPSTDGPHGSAAAAISRPAWTGREMPGYLQNEAQLSISLSHAAQNAHHWDEMKVCDPLPGWEETQ
ncbi:hypothetical protein CapIbe_012723 [Capra ibex]